jgi:hypothetical protein
MRRAVIVFWLSLLHLARLSGGTRLSQSVRPPDGKVRRTGSCSRPSFHTFASDECPLSQVRERSLALRHRETDGCGSSSRVESAVPIVGTMSIELLRGQSEDLRNGLLMFFEQVSTWRRETRGYWNNSRRLPRLHVGRIHARCAATCLPTDDGRKRCRAADSSNSCNSHGRTARPGCRPPARRSHQDRG